MEYEKIEDSYAYKVGYLRGMVKTAIQYLKSGAVHSAQLHLEDGLRTLKMDGDKWDA